jgi:two-component system OmpR family sensor kinase
VVAVVAEDLRAPHPSIDLQVDTACGARPRIVGQPARFHQAILNVGSNACRHAPPTTTVRFVVTSTDSDVVVQVIDRGPGVDEAEADKIFLPFYRPESSRGRDGRGGAGLGLAIATQIIERHHGHITVEPTIGGGATFVITVPQPATEHRPAGTGPSTPP